MFGYAEQRKIRFLKMENRMQTLDAADRFIRYLACLESFLLKDHETPIKDNLAKRISKLIGKDKKSRDIIQKKIKTFYEIRSRILHESNYDDVTEIDIQNYLRPYVVNAFRMTTEKAVNFSTVNEFVRWIDRDEKIEEILPENICEKFIESAKTKYGFTADTLQKALSEAIGRWISEKI